MRSADEQGRLNALRAYQILDTAAEKAFDDLTLLAGTICEAPISLVSLVDRDRQWFKARRGIDVDQTPREQAFCAHAIQQEKVMVVEDAARDARFIDNPLVTGDPGIRFYAGAPLKVVDGFQLGTLCVIDRKPRTLSASQIRALETLSDAVVAQLELKRTIEELKSLEKLLPLCAWCRKVKPDVDENGGWRDLHEYVADLTPVTHGICPECQRAQNTGG